ncbi:MAG: 50S ribosomal protein L11 methyltransferase, partial [Bacteroidota bacterium]
INPKMAFGTGHHETTFSMMTIMRQLDFSGKKVFDYGCGTGILAILASKMGAKSVLAIDYDPLSYENTIENCHKNQIINVTPQLGELASVEADNFDIILANINRNVILDSLASLFNKIKEGGQVLISGFLHSDEDMMATTVDIIGFSIKNVARRGEWICMQLEK